MPRTMRRLRSTVPINTTTLPDTFFQRLYRAGGWDGVARWLATKDAISLRSAVMKRGAH